MNKHIHTMAKDLVEKYGTYDLTIGQASEALNVGRNHLPRILHQAGILVRRSGTKKLVSVYDVAALHYMGRISPIDNTSRPFQITETKETPSPAATGKSA